MSDTFVPMPQMLCFALYSANHAMQAAYKPMLDRVGLTYPQFLVLTLLWEQDDQPMSQVGATLQLESNTLTPMLKRMEAAGLVSRSRDSRDERQVRLRLTAAGLAMKDQAAEITSCVRDRTGMTVEALMDLNARIRALRDILRGAPPAPAAIPAEDQT